MVTEPRSGCGRVTASEAELIAIQSGLTAATVCPSMCSPTRSVQFGMLLTSSGIPVKGSPSTSAASSIGGSIGPLDANSILCTLPLHCNGRCKVVHTSTPRGSLSLMVRRCIHQLTPSTRRQIQTPLQRGPSWLRSLVTLGRTSSSSNGSTASRYARPPSKVGRTTENSSRET